MLPKVYSLGFARLDDGRQLFGIADQDECFGTQQRSNDGALHDLGGLVDQTNVEFSLDDQWVGGAKAGDGDNVLRTNGKLVENIETF
jgi:hypothetical protein